MKISTTEFKFWEKMQSIGWDGKKVTLPDLKEDFSVWTTILNSDQKVQEKCDLMEKLLKIGGSLDCVLTSGGDTLLMYITRIKKRESEDRFQLSKWLLEKGVDINIRDFENEHVGFWLFGMEDKSDIEELTFLYLDSGLDTKLRSYYTGEPWEDDIDVKNLVEIWNVKSQLNHSLPLTAVKKSTTRI